MRDRLQAVHGLIRGGHVPVALATLQELEAGAQHDARMLQALAECYTHCGRHHDAYRCHESAVQVEPRDPRYLYNLAAASVATGRIREAERLFDGVIELNPADADAWQNRSTLRRQTADANHIAQLERQLARVPAGAPGEVPLCYALAKEYEDIEECERSFEWLSRGARARRRQLSYRVELDLQAMEQIRSAFTPSLLEAAPPPASGPGPIFILGLPRSGTTLLDRIVSSHSQVASLGEIDDLPLAVMHAAGPARSKQDLICRAARADFGALGREYLRRTAGYGATRICAIDKTPLNFLYLGLIRLALPAARIVHVRRHPLDSCYAMYKTLFRMGYPFSYDLEDLARYYAGYRALMKHWRESMPGAFLDVDYEALVRDQVAVSRQVLAHCHLDWEAACESFHLNPAPAATASAAQVREPLYTRSAGAWRRYRRQLEPLVQRLGSLGVELE